MDYEVRGRVTATVIFLFAVAGWVGCGSPAQPDAGMFEPFDASRPAMDGGGVPHDGGTSDSGTTTTPDARVDIDAGSDAGRTDGGAASHADGGPAATDAGVTDAGATDAGATDAGPDLACGAAGPPVVVDSTRPLSFRAHPTAVGTDICHFAVGDYDADRDLDVIAASCDGTILRIDKTAAGWARPVTLGTVTPRPRVYGVYAGDFNGDGREDFLVSEGLRRASIWRGDGRGGFSTPLVLDGGAIINYGQVRAVADFNLDGRTDIIASDRLIWGRAETVVDERAFTETDRNTTLTVAHFDRLDRAPDLIATDNTGSTLLRNRGDGTFTDAGSAPVYDAPPYAGLRFAGMVPVNRDCSSDLITIQTSFSPQDRLCVRAGPGYGEGLVRRLYEGTDRITTCVDVGTTQGWALGDVDGDGDLDLVTSNWGVDVYRNTGDHLVHSYLTFPLTGLTSGRDGPLSLQDVDSDGDADVLLLQWDYRAGSGVLSFMENTTSAP